MTRPWAAYMTSTIDGRHPVRRFFLGQFLALLASVATLAGHQALGPLLAHSIYLFCLPALALCVALGGGGSGVTATLILGAGAYLADTRGGLAEPERMARAAAFLILGAVVSFVGERLRQAWSRQRLLSAQREEYEAILRSSLDTVADPTIAIDEHGTVLNFSHPAEVLFGWSRDEVIGKSVKMLMPPNYAEAHDGYMGRYLAGGPPRVIGSSRQVAGLRKDGAEFPMELRVGELRLGGKRFFTGVIHDLSTVREAGRRSDELRAQLTQVWSLNSMGEMASVLAHELNQPLSAVANYMRAARTLIAQLEIDDDDLLDAVSRAGDQAVRAGEIIRTMRDLATRGGTEQKPESLSAILGEIDFIVGLMVRDAGARVFYNLHSGPDIVLADRIQIQQLVVNLVRNAIDAVAKFPNREIRISTRPEADANFITTVEDSGPGVDPSVMGRVFQPLASTKPEGMGLGLSICSAIVENHGGRIWVEPSPLGGAAFSFVLARAGAKSDDVGRSDRVRRR